MKTTLAFGFLFCLFTVAGWGQAVDTAAVVREVDSLVQDAGKLALQKNFDKALKTNEIAEKLALENFGDSSAVYGSACLNHGRILYQKTDYKNAEKWFLNSKAIQEKNKEISTPDYIRTLRACLKFFV